jgi:hypothetical protein
MSSSSWRRQIVNNSAAPAAELPLAGGKMPGGTPRPATNLRCRRYDDSSETFGPGACLDASTNTQGENLPLDEGFLVSISHEHRAACVRKTPP